MSTATFPLGLPANDHDVSIPARLREANRYTFHIKPWVTFSDGQQLSEQAAPALLEHYRPVYQGAHGQVFRAKDLFNPTALYHWQSGGFAIGWDLAKFDGLEGRGYAFTLAKEKGLVTLHTLKGDVPVRLLSITAAGLLTDTPLGEGPAPERRARKTPAGRLPGQLILF